MNIEEAKAEAMTILTRGAHNYALDKAAKAACKAMGKCMEHEELSTSHHPDCDKVRAAIRAEKR